MRHGIGAMYHMFHDHKEVYGPSSLSVSSSPSAWCRPWTHRSSSKGSSSDRDLPELHNRSEGMDLVWPQKHYTATSSRVFVCFHAGFIWTTVSLP